MTAALTRRFTLFIWEWVLLATVLSYGCRPNSRIPDTHRDTLPARLTNAEFWKMVTDFSEPDGYFPSDNFVSNESGYQSVIPTLRNTSMLDGVSLGVGPEQNFTYIVAFEPKMTFIIDIRRENMLEHLFYKALMETSADRGEFLSRLFARPAPREQSVDATPEVLLRGYKSQKGRSTLFERNLKRVVEYLENEKGFSLSDADNAGIRHVAQAFFKSGPDITFTFIGRPGGSMHMPTYSDLIAETDGISRNWNFLATEDQFRMIQRLQQKNLIVPLVGDFAGPKAIRSVGRYLREHQAIVRVFYTSNVEQYLFEDNRTWKRFYDNVAVLPIDSTSTFIRYVLDTFAIGRQRTTLTSLIKNGYSFGGMGGYYDLVRQSH
jgi:hypothetical protein